MERISKDRIHQVANEVDATQYQTSAQYWEAMLIGVTQAQVDDDEKVVQALKERHGENIKEILDLNYLRLSEEKEKVVQEERERIVELYTRYREHISPTELRKIMLEGKPSSRES